MIKTSRVNPSTRLAPWALLILAIPTFGHVRTAYAGTVNVGQVSARAASKRRRKAESGFASTETETRQRTSEVLSTTPNAGAAQALAQTEGMNVYGYGGTSSTARYEIVARGIKVGWSSVNGDVERNGITVLFDHVPMNNLISHNGQWDSNELPILKIISATHVIYGPGNPASRWFDSLGGTVDFIPIEPGRKPGASVGVTVGSDATLGTNFSVDTGEHNGWSSVFAGGYTSNHTFRTGSFNAPSQGRAFFGKTRDRFGNGTLSFGAYAADTDEFRPNFIPLSPIAGVTTEGLNANAPLYSQPTSGYYSSLPESVWFKQIKVQSALLYSRMNLGLAPDLRLHDELWYRYGYRLHYRITNYVPGNSANTEYYDPTSRTFGNRLAFVLERPHNRVTVGAWWIQQRYHTPYAGYNAADGTSAADPIQFNSDYLYNTYLQEFAQDRIQATRALSVTPGIAAQQFETQFYNAGAADFPAAAANPSASNVTTAGDSSKSFSRVSPSLGLRYVLTRHVAFYGRYSPTYQNPTDNTFGAYNTPVDLSTLQPVRSVDYEAGIKFRRHRRLEVNADYFYDQLSNETVATYLSNIQLTKFAAAAAVYRGVSLGFNATPDWHYRFWGNTTVQNDVYTTFVPSGTTQSYAGYPISNTAEQTINIGGEYHMLAGRTLVTPVILWQYVGRRYLFSNLAGAPTRQTLPGYALLNLAVNFRVPVRDPALSGLHSVRFSLGVDNVMDKQYNAVGYVTSGGYFGGSSAGAILVDPGAPRQYFLTADMHF